MKARSKSNSGQTKATFTLVVHDASGEVARYSGLNAASCNFFPPGYLVFNAGSLKVPDRFGGRYGYIRNPKVEVTDKGITIPNMQGRVMQLGQGKAWWLSGKIATNGSVGILGRNGEVVRECPRVAGPIKSLVFSGKPPKNLVELAQVDEDGYRLSPVDLKLKTSVKVEVLKS